MMSVRAAHRVRSSLGFVILGVSLLVLAVTAAAIALRLIEPVSTVLIVGDLTAAQRAQVSRVVEPFSQLGLARLDKSALLREVSRIDWTREVRLRRIWPSRLEVSVETEVPVARWGAERLLSAQGKVIAGELENPRELPLLEGPEERAVLVMERYFLAREIVAPLGLRVRRLTLDDVVGWSIVFDSGLHLILGRNDSIARMKRFQRLYYSRLGIDAHRFARADARYTNGVAVVLRAQAPEQIAKRGEGAAIATHDGG